MNWLKDLPIGRRLGAAFALLLALAVAMAAGELVALGELNDSLRLIKDDRVPKVTKLAQVADAVGQIALEQRNALLHPDALQVEKALKHTDELRQGVSTTLDAITSTIHSEEGRRDLAALQEARSAYLPLQQRFAQLVRGGQRDEATRLLADTMDPAQRRYMAAIEKLSELQVGMVSRAADDGDAAYRRDRWLLGAALALMLGLGAALAWTITRSVTQPLAQAVAVAERVAAGDLSGHIDSARRDEAGRLLAALGHMSAQLRQIVQRVREGSDAIATGSGQIATGNGDLSQRTEEQASALQQTAASMEQLGTTVSQNADHARHADELAQGASAVAGRGGEVVQQVVQTMQGISQSSRRIADIIGTIDGIAFQTNILALNAAVEAARAGEQGRGFAVVAGEVRTLAQRSAEAAREIKSLIAASVEQVAHGSGLVDTAGRTMTEIVAANQRVTEIMAQISHAAREQSAGVAQVGQAVSQMDQTTQQNAALVEESAAAADSLRQQAQRLVEAVAVFRLA